MNNTLLVTFDCFVTSKVIKSIKDEHEIYNKIDMWKQVIINCDLKCFSIRTIQRLAADSIVYIMQVSNTESLYI